MATAVFFLRPFDKLSGMNEKPSHFQVLTNHYPPDIPIPAFANHAPALNGSNDFPSPAGRHKSHGPKIDIISIILFLLVIALSITYVIIKRWRLAVEQAARAETDKVNAELSFLKAQIDPHFLFNTLNNIYSQAVMKDEKTPESIMKLSNIMRYVTEEAIENFVPLTDETNFISDYIELQRLRLGARTTLDFVISGRLEGKSIAPLILITLIENVFKYGISNSEPSHISIALKAEDDSISFFCRNKLMPLKHQLESTGIGIKNTRKRLDHLYPNKYLLNIKEEEGFFSVHLILQS